MQFCSTRTPQEPAPCQEPHPEPGTTLPRAHWQSDLSLMMSDEGGEPLSPYHELAPSNPYILAF